MTHDSEMQILSSAIYNIDNFNELAHQDPDIFTTYKSKLLFDIFRKLFKDNIQPDLTTIGLRLENEGVKKQVIDDIIISLSNMRPVYDFTGLLNEYKKRMFIAKIGIASKDLSKPIDEKTRNDLIDSINDYREKSNVSCSSVISLDKSDINIDETYKRVQYVHPGYDILNKKMRGFFRGQLITVAARPGIGKTTLMLNIAKKVSKNTGRVVFISMEMLFEELYSKLLSSESDVENWKIETLKMDNEERARVNLANRELLKLPIDIYNESNFSSISSIIRKYNGSAKLIIIDYLQLIKGSKGENQNLRIGNITTELKQLALKTRTPIVELSQLNREIEKTKRKPQLSDLRDSGSIEQDSDVVIFLHEEEFDFSVIVAKNRKGPTGEIDGMMFEKEYSRFTERRFSI